LVSKIQHVKKQPVGKCRKIPTGEAFWQENKNVPEK
jgi:hypothetical protein